VNRVLKRLWYDRTVRTQILVAIGAINICAILVAGTIAVVNARKATRIEIEASLEIAKQFVRNAIQAMPQTAAGDGTADSVAQLSDRLRVANLRHVRIFMADGSGKLTPLSALNKESAPAQDPPPAPRWFAALVEPSIEPRALSVALADPARGAVVIVEQPLAGMPKLWDRGTVLISGEPGDEIAEVWEDVSAVAPIWITLDIVVLAVLYLVIGRMLVPLANLSRGMLKLEDGQYATRIQEPKVKELAAIADRFNQLAEALGRSRAENARLYGQLITVQEGERREIAKELHDEASPCLFGIMANTVSIQRLLSRRNDRKTGEVQGHVTEILKITDHLNQLNRALLKKLRPVALGRVALSDVLSDLMRELQKRYPEVAISHEIAMTTQSYGEAVDLTVYRCIQEGVTNAIRHGKADSILMEIVERKPPRGATNGHAHPTLQLLMQDDGSGLVPGTPAGFGITVMRERVHALGGSCLIEGRASIGTTLRVTIPLGAATAKPQHALETVYPS
jgi:two-component system sensor histidine kinase UhpB